MARIEIKMIEKFVFETRIKIRITDVNYAHHVGNDTFVTLINEARMRFFKNLEIPESDIGTLLIADLAISYKSQSFYGDELKFEIGAGEFNKYGCDIFYRVTDIKTGNLVILAKNGIVFFDYTKNKVTQIPDAFSSLLS
jgi:acyl-CoA thioester hydrolase